MKNMRIGSPRRSSGAFGGVVVVLLVAAAVVAIVILQRELRLPAPAVIEVIADRPGIGRKTRVTITASEPKLGLARVVVTGEGAGLVKKVLHEVTLSKGERSASFTFELGRDRMPELRPGDLVVEVVAQAQGTRLRKAAPVSLKKSWPVRLHPPELKVKSPFVHAAQGGAEIVVYDVGPESRRDGVVVGPWFFPGFPLPEGSSGQKFALFASPYDLDGQGADGGGAARILLVAEDELGNRAEQRFVDKYIRRPMGKDVIELKEAGMKKVTEEVYPRTPDLQPTGDLLADYLQLNNELRRRNMAELVSLGRKSAAKFLWNETFLPMGNAAVKGNFADRRSYTFEGKPVDTQDHLGIDLASSKQAPVLSPNAGVVVLARYFGIFGNCVVVDHGHGLQSLSAHLSSIAVKEGDAVKRGQELGRTGATGLAGGDHLHFTMVLQGLPVTPIEWWDGHWIQDRLKLKLAAALPWTR